MAREIRGQKELGEQVRDAGLCTGCGACVNLCPYQTYYHDRTIVLNPCDIKAGRCYAFCPRTPADLEEMRRLLFQEAELTPEIGPVRAFHIVRAADARLREQASSGNASPPSSPRAGSDSSTPAPPFTNPRRSGSGQKASSLSPRRWPNSIERHGV
ncbi:MAG: hypothetical protein CVU61_08500 [Deltaproteobacteria bacterium HGW-Deltaproteobacteria-19]|nr:MAG: hypothetical protein CVU61_08500 [Deltaproteobacteria bacterium HGW-Deltaproteobacteria-19]